MTEASLPIALWNVERQSLEDAELHFAISNVQLDDWQTKWIPALIRSVMRVQTTAIVRPQWPQSHRWDWRAKAEALKGMLAYRGFSIVCAGVTQGMMIVDTTTKRGRLDEQQGKNLVYVNFVENAPWNRKELVDVPRYRGVGSILIGAAMALSKEEEFKGRIGLHSLPQANGFYANHCGMTDLGPDPAYLGMRYFETLPQQADEFLARGQQP